MHLSNKIQIQKENVEKHNVREHHGKDSDVAAAELGWKGSLTRWNLGNGSQMDELSFWFILS